jgi:hypothetical protein
MEIAFKRNGKLYNQHYAFLPTQTTSGQWIWFSLYYTRETGHSWITLTPYEFLIDSGE